MEASIGDHCSIAPDVVFGEGVTVFGFANLYGCTIGSGSRIGTFVEVQRGTVIGQRVRVQSHTFICSDVVIEDDVFVGHNVSFINDRYPSAPMAAAKTWTAEKTVVRRGASIGTGAVIMCGIEIGEGALVGAGAVVTKDVAPHSIVAGVPAKFVRVLTEDERCSRRPEMP